MGPPGEVGRRARQADADEAHRAVAQAPRRRDHHRVIGRGATQLRPPACRARSPASLLRSPTLVSVVRGIRPSSNTLLVQPGLEAVAVGGDGVPGPVEVVVAGRVALGVGRVGAAGHTGHVGHDPARQDDRARAAGVSSSTISSTVTSARSRGQHDLLLHAGDAPHHHVAAPVGVLGVDDRDVRVERRHGRQLLAGERAGDRGDRAGVVDEIGAEVAAQHGERQSRGAGGVAVGHPGVAVLLDLQRPRPAVLDGVAEAVQRADAGVATPREDHPGDAPGADQLVVDDVRGHPHDGEVTPALADDLVAGGDRDQVGEPLQGHRVAVVDELGDGVGQGGDHGHRRILSLMRASERQRRLQLAKVSERRLPMAGDDDHARHRT